MIHLGDTDACRAVLAVASAVGTSWSECERLVRLVLIRKETPSQELQPKHEVVVITMVTLG